MATFFGIEERNAQGFIDHNTVCLPHLPGGKVDRHSIVSPLRNEDIVFIKHGTPELALHIKAVGVVRSDYPEKHDSEVCLPVTWVWRGDKVLENLDERLEHCAEALYEEHNIVVQREIIDLLPPKYQLAAEW